MKYTILTVLFVLLTEQICMSQSTYYAPNNNVNITITIREPYKPIDWSKFSNDFSNQINAIVAKREAQKKYLDDILYETINSTHSYTQLTNDNVVNSCLLNLKTKIIERLNVLNNLLKSGQITPESYESSLRKTYYDYVGANQVFLNLVVYKSNSMSSQSSYSQRSTFEETFRNTVGSITSFEVNEYSITFNLSGLSYPNNNINNLYQLVSSSCEGQFSNYKSRWVQEKNSEKKLNDYKRASEFAENEKKKSNNQIWHNFKVEVFGARQNCLNQLNEEQKNEYYRNEKKVIFNSLMNEYTWSLGTRKMVKAQVDDYIKIDSQKNNFADLIDRPVPLNVLIAINNSISVAYRVSNIPKVPLGIPTGTSGFVQ
jgi:hypothetical protein